MKKILETLRRKWAEYLLEILVIVIGILGAFTLDSWNEARNDHNLEKKLLIELNSNLKTNIKTLKTSIDSYSEDIRGIDIILNHFQNSNTNDSLRLFYLRAIYVETLDLSYSTFETLKAIGFDIFRNDQIRLSTIELYEVTYAHHIKEVDKVSSVYLQSYMDWNFYNRHKVDIMFSQTEFPKDEAYRFVSNYLSSKKFLKTNLINGHNQLLENTIELKNIIDIYLANKD